MLAGGGTGAEEYMTQFQWRQTIKQSNTCPCIDWKYYINNYWIPRLPQILMDRENKAKEKLRNGVTQNKTNKTKNHISLVIEKQ